MIVSEEEVARQQVEEDLRLYGSRPEPPESVEVDENTRLASLPPKRDASEFEAAVNRPAKIRKKGESQTYNFQAVTAMDWNSGTSPLDAWLNTSAFPSAACAPGRRIPGDTEENLIAQEAEEIKVFRNVHIGMAPEPLDVKANPLEEKSFRSWSLELKYTTGTSRTDICFCQHIWLVV